jgi:uncharacterized membrane protein YdcZ (DUF606 family)
MWVQYAALAAVGGAMLPLQALINAWLGDRINGALWAMACSFLIGTIGIHYSAPAAADGAANRPIHGASCLGLGWRGAGCR